jgi:hypothetical protein
MLKSLIRYGLGRLTKSFGLQTFFREFYRLWAIRFTQNLDLSFVESIWLRRSTVTVDFTPFWSDIDLTVVVREEKLKVSPLPSDLLVKDLQFISAFHLPAYNRTGGFRHRQLTSWKLLHGSSKLQNFPAEDKSKLAFELAHEAYLLFHQLQRKFGEVESVWRRQSITKLIAELKRLEIYWQDEKQSDLFISREKIIPHLLTDREISESGIWLENFFQQLKAALHSTLQSFDHTTLIMQESEGRKKLSLEMIGKPVIVVDDPLQISVTSQELPKYFIATGTFIDLVKGVGVQDQALLNDLAKVDDYYRDFNRQRLANDLIGAMLSNPGNRELMYYCFKNINDFYRAFYDENLSSWPQIEAHWLESQSPSSDSPEFQDLCLRYLEVLRSMR